MRPARHASKAKATAPPANTSAAASPAGFGITGTLGASNSAAAPTPASAATSTHSSTSRALTSLGRRTAGSAEAARITAPAGRFRAPATCTNPFSPTSAPGVASAWMTSIIAITENAIPSTTARPSCTRAANTDRLSAATAASAPAAPTTTTCTPGATITWRSAVAASRPTGTSAAAAKMTTTGNACATEKRRWDISKRIGRRSTAVP